MRRKTDPEVLRAQAQELLKKAKRIEEGKFVKAGQFLYKHYINDFADFDLEKFKEDLKEIFTVKKRGRKSKNIINNS